MIGNWKGERFLQGWEKGRGKGARRGSRFDKDEEGEGEKRMLYKDEVRKGTEKIRGMGKGEKSKGDQGRGKRKGEKKRGKRHFR